MKEAIKVRNDFLRGRKLTELSLEEAINLIEEMAQTIADYEKELGRSFND